MREQELPYGHTVIGFDSVEEMNEYMAKQEQDAVERTLPRQWEIGWGSYVIRLVEDLVIWAHIFTEEEFLELERNAEGPGTPEEIEEEVQAELAQLREGYNLGYRYGKWYSVIEPAGEYGDAHVSSLWPITKADFALGLSNDWEIGSPLMDRLRAEITEAIKRKEEG